MPEYPKKLRNILYNKRLSEGQKLAFLKKEVVSGEYEDAINSNAILKQNKLKHSKFTSAEAIIQRDTNGFTADLKKELYWILYNVKNESSIINQFLVSKHEFEKKFFLEDFSTATVLLDDIRGRFGENLWTIEMTLLLKEYQFGTNENWETLSNYLQKIGSPFYQFVINFYSKRIEQNMSYENCYSQFQNEFNEVLSESMVKDFLVFKSLITANFEYEHKNLEGVLLITNIFSTIDQYLLLIEVLTRLVSNNSNNNRLIANVVKKISPIIDKDFRLSNILNLIDDKSELIVLESNKNILPIIDEYSDGNFEKCLTLCLEQFNEKPCSFEIYEIYVKSLISLNYDFQRTNKSQIIDKILLDCYHSLLYDKNSELSRNKLLKLSLSFSSFDFGKQLFGFVIGLFNEPFINRWTTISCLSSIINNPKILSLKSGNRFDLIRKKYLFFEESISFQINMLISGIEVNQPLILKNEVQYKIYLGRKYFIEEKYEDVINELEKFIDSKIAPFYYDEILFLLYESYIAIGQLDKAILLAGTIMADKIFYTNKLDINKLCQQVQSKGIEYFIERIETVIVFSYIMKDYDLYGVFADFISFYEDECPSKLNIDSLIKKFGKAKVIFFLKEICTTSTLKYSLELGSIDKVEQERFAICKILKDIDKPNSAIYDNEISEILRTTSVRNAIKEVNEGRLYVNIEGLKGLQLSNVKESFSRFKEIETIVKVKKLMGFNASKERNWMNGSFSTEKKSQFDDPSFLAFKNIYIETREKFLYSKEYGLESCLSGRIRHGTLKNLLRRVFDNLNLVTAKTNDVYLENIYWATQFGPETEINKKIQDRLRKFSQDIDSLIYHTVENLIQIQTERDTTKPLGLFNYSTNDEALFSFYSEYKDLFTNYNSLISRIYTELVATTLLYIVPYVQRTLTEKVKNNYQELIERLQLDLKNITIPQNTDLFANISKSSTDIQTTIDNVSEWFIFSTTDSSSLLEIEIIINAAVEITNKFNSNCSINPQIIKKYPEDLSVISSSVMIYVFHILMDNIIEHSKLGSENLKITIEMFQIENFIEIKITNNIASNLDTNKISNKLLEVKNNWNNHENIERSNIEGGSGFDKIKRILLYDALAKTDRFEYSVSKKDVSISLFLPLNQNKNEENTTN